METETSITTLDSCPQQKASADLQGGKNKKYKPKQQEKE